MPRRETQVPPVESWERDTDWVRYDPKALVQALLPGSEQIVATWDARWLRYLQAARLWAEGLTLKQVGAAVGSKKDASVPISDSRVENMVSKVIRRLVYAKRRSLGIAPE